MTRDLSGIASDNLTYQLLYYITTPTCATVSPQILSYAAIYGYGLTQSGFTRPNTILTGPYGTKHG